MVELKTLTSDALGDSEAGGWRMRRRTYGSYDVLAVSVSSGDRAPTCVWNALHAHRPHYVRTASGCMSRWRVSETGLTPDTGRA